MLGLGQYTFSLSVDVVQMCWNETKVTRQRRALQNAVVHRLREDIMPQWAEREIRTVFFEGPDYRTV